MGQLSLQRRFIIVFVAFSAVVSVLGGGIAHAFTRRALEAGFDEEITTLAQTIAEVGLPSDQLGLLEAVAGEDSLFLALRQRLLKLRGTSIDQAYLFRSDLTALVTTLPSAEYPLGSVLDELRPFGAQIIEAGSVGASTSPLLCAQRGDRCYKYAFVRIGQEPVLFAILASADLSAPLATFNRIFGLGALLSAGFAALLGWFLASTVTGPLDRLGRAAVRIREGGLDEAFGEEGGEELGRLSRALEQLRKEFLHRDDQLRLTLAEAAHEIRNPLWGIELFATTAAETGEATERTRALGKIRSEILALNRIIDDSLTFARPIEVEETPHDIRGPIREAVELVEIQLRKEGGELEVELPSDPVLARANPEDVKRVTLNLLRNAAQAGQKIRLRGEDEGGEVMISVLDDGGGVPKDMEGRVFDPFVSDKVEGAGLGLSIVKRVVEGNQGRVELDREETGAGRGAEFRVYFRGAVDIPIP